MNCSDCSLRSYDINALHQNKWITSLAAMISIKLVNMENHKNELHTSNLDKWC